VAHACNPSYLGGRDQKDLERPYFEKNHHKNRAGGVAQGEGPELKPNATKKKKLERPPISTKKLGMAQLHRRRK
jgi:hypothetical protein